MKRAGKLLVMMLSVLMILCFPLPFCAESRSRRRRRAGCVKPVPFSLLCLNSPPRFVYCAY